MIERYLRGTLYTKQDTKMKDTTNRTATIKKLIKIELEKCNDKAWPHVCEMKTTQEGYQRIEKMIINYAANEGMPIGSAIALIEQEFTHAKK